MSGAGYRGRTRLHPKMRDANQMTKRPWIQKHEAARMGAMDAKRISSYVYSKALAGQTVTENEVAILLANSRDVLDTSRGTRRPTQDERERARYALRELAKNSRKLRKFIRFEDGGHEE